MKSVSAATCILVVGLLATVCPAANPIQSFGYPSVLPQQPQAQPDVRVATLGFGARSIASTSTSNGRASDGLADYGGVETVPVQATEPIRTPAAVNAPSPSSRMAMASCDAPVGYQPGSQYMAGGWSGCAPVQLPCACPTWFGGLYGLIMDMDDDRNFWVATTDADPNELLLNTRSAGYDVAGGTEVRFGRTFGGCRWGMEFVYWGLYPDTSYASISTYDVVGNLVPTLDFTDVCLTHPAGAGTAIDWIITGDPNPEGVAAPLRTFEIRRSYELNNVEVNLLSGPLTSGMYGAGVRRRWTTNWLFGFRYLKFDEALRMIYENGDGVIDYDAPFVAGNSDQVYYDIKTENNLAGVQLGVDSDYALTRRLQFDMTSRFGIYGNSANQRSRIFNSWGDACLALSPGDAFNVRSSSNDVSFLGELRLGLSYMLGTHWRVTGGYRAMGATGIARTVNQIPLGSTMHATYANRDVDRDGSLVVHGGYFGAEFGW